jgi:hypothetical protein
VDLSDTDATTGTLPDGRLSSNVPLKNGQNLFQTTGGAAAPTAITVQAAASQVDPTMAWKDTGGVTRVSVNPAGTMSGNITANALANGTYGGNYTISGGTNTFAGTHSGDGSGLMNVSASGLASGTYMGNYTFSGGTNTFAGAHSGDGSGLMNVTASGLADGTYGGNYNISGGSNTFAGMHSGNGSLLTNVTASSLATNASYDIGSGTFTANSFSGSGSNLTSLSPSNVAAGTFMNSATFTNSVTISGATSSLTVSSASTTTFNNRPGFAVTSGAPFTVPAGSGVVANLYAFRSQLADNAATAASAGQFYEAKPDDGCIYRTDGMSASVECNGTVCADEGFPVGVSCRDLPSECLPYCVDNSESRTNKVQAARLNFPADGRFDSATNRFIVCRSDNDQASGLTVTIDILRSLCTSQTSCGAPVVIATKTLNLPGGRTGPLWIFVANQDLASTRYADTSGGLFKFELRGSMNLGSPTTMCFLVNISPDPDGQPPPTFKTTYAPNPTNQIQTW